MDPESLTTTQWQFYSGLIAESPWLFFDSVSRGQTFLAVAAAIAWFVAPVVGRRAMSGKWIAPGRKWSAVGVAAIIAVLFANANYQKFHDIEAERNLAVGDREAANQAKIAAERKLDLAEAKLRPYISCTPVRWEEDGKTYDYVKIEKKNGRTSLHFNLELENQGKTIAKRIEFETPAGVIARGEDGTTSISPMVFSNLPRNDLAAGDKTWVHYELRSSNDPVGFKGVEIPCRLSYRGTIKPDAPSYKTESQHYVTKDSVKLTGPNIMD